MFTSRVYFLCGPSPIALSLLATLDEAYRDDPQLVTVILHQDCDEQFLRLSNRFHCYRIKDGALLCDEIKPSIEALAVMLWWPNIICAQEISVFTRGVINIHPSPLPYCRGKNPNFWSVLTAVPYGATAYYVSDKLDSGNCIYRLMEPYCQTRSAKNVWDSSINMCDQVLRHILLHIWEIYNRLTYHCIQPFTPAEQAASSQLHKAKDRRSLQVIDANRTIKVFEFVRLASAFTFSPYPGLCVEIEGKMYSINLDIKAVDDHRPSP